MNTPLLRTRRCPFGAASAATLALVASLSGLAGPAKVQSPTKFQFLPTGQSLAKAQSFCESGSATALQLGAAGAVWIQQWGLPAVDWYDCSAEPNIPLLNENVVGRQETRTSGAPAIDANLVLRLPFQGTITLTAYEDDNPAEVAGQIEGAMRGTFVADLNAAHAVVTDTTITIAFGQSLHSDPDALITVTSATGKFQSIRAVGDWQWHVLGTVTIARVPARPPQLNIFDALTNSALILGAEEETVLSGDYSRGAP
ncbi:MAG TPA: hypothetical protein VFT34_12310 [Verrucomicrobiae bacterium]|nr:hypothetical protein [Verrucomicrobiae bacterium]